MKRHKFKKKDKKSNRGVEKEKEKKFVKDETKNKGYKPMTKERVIRRQRRQ